MADVSLQQAMELALEAQRQGRVAEARGFCRDILRAVPEFPPALHLLAVMFLAEGEHRAAEEHFLRAIAGEPGNHEYHSNLGVLYAKLSRLAEGERHLREAIRLKPDYAEAYINLAGVVGEAGNLTESIELSEKAVAMKPAAVALDNLGGAMLRSGRIADAIASYRRAAAARADHATTQSNLLFALNYDHTLTAKEIFEEHVRWGRRLAELVPPMGDHPNDCDPERRLRVGYFSADFRMHSVAFFLTAILQRHDHKQVEVFCYSTSAPEDAMTRRVQSLADQWRPVLGLPDERIAEIIREDKIDILVDLATHTSSNRMPVFARKPAPIQVSYLGYPNTSGLAAMDYRLTDSYADPVGQSEDLNVERLVRLDPCAWCYEPPPQAPAVVAPPCTLGEPVTFGSFNALAKVNVRVIEAWARILKEVPGSRLLLKAGAFVDAPTKARIVAEFAKFDVPAARLGLRGHFSTTGDHLAAYSRVDIALDTFPYNGTTTTCEAMWMGAAVVALGGTTHAGRVGLSLLKNVGLGEQVAKDVDDYVAIAVRLAGNKIKLKKLRAGMRKRMADSPLMDGLAMARPLESAYREMWRTWVGRKQAANSDTAASHVTMRGE